MRATDVEQKSADAVRLLAIGNRFIWTATRCLPALAEAGEHELIHGAVIVGGSSPPLRSEKLDKSVRLFIATNGKGISISGGDRKTLTPTGNYAANVSGPRQR